MLLRKDGSGVIAIPQPSHAWLSGQMASAWGNRRFALPTPNDEVCLAAGQHDIGWLTSEETPALDAEAGLPQEFLRVPTKVHIALWCEGVRHARAFGRYPPEAETVLGCEGNLYASDVSLGAAPYGKCSPLLKYIALRA